MRPRCAREDDPVLAAMRAATSGDLPQPRRATGDAVSLLDRGDKLAIDSGLGARPPRWWCCRRSSRQRWITPSCRSFRYRKSAASPLSPPYREQFFFLPALLPRDVPPHPATVERAQQRAERTVNDPPPTVSACAASSRGTLRDVHI
ncbi:hypothetical protein HPB50_013321 [Hyalomma asiaticum]|uniref:Uncharacterized protein n=1 Tax=Hyalomma asiaticum TaxID=266040 RepID=A0ACB7THK3_HYAAI|nr:hypothetical protein HPB50_013321 [Hyalomma asiaticum]